MTYWEITVSPSQRVYFSTNGKFIPEMVIDLAVRRGEMYKSFAAGSRVREITEQEYLENVWPD